MADISREAIVLAAGGRAVLLQIAHPSIGLGVAEHSDFEQAPLHRLHGTLAFVYAISLGTEGDVAIVRREVNRAHAPVRGPSYSAMDPDLQLWVAATLYDSAIVMWERIHGPIEPDAADLLYREYARLGTELQLPHDAWPADRAAFASYWNAQVESLEVSDAARQISRSLLWSRKLPWYLRALLPIVRLVTAGMLPASVREQFDFAWSTARGRRLERLLAVAGAFNRVAPSGLRHYPSRYYLRRLRARP